MAINTESQFGTELAEIPYTLHNLEIEIIVMTGLYWMEPEWVSCERSRQSNLSVNLLSLKN